MKSIIYKKCETKEEIEAIIRLQSLNIPTALSDKEILKEGFVTIKHNKKLLTLMNDPIPHVLATVHGQVVGYALVMDKKHRREIPILETLFESLGQITYKGQIISNQNYFVMGQICIAKAYRSQGIFVSSN